MTNATILSAASLAEAAATYGTGCADIIVHPGHVSASTLAHFATASVSWPTSSPWHRRAASTATAFERITWTARNLSRPQAEASD